MINFDFIKSIDISTYVTYLINFATMAIIIYSLYKLYNEYNEYQKFDSNNITKVGDLDIINKDYTDCELYKYYNSLSTKDKEYFEHLINYTRIKYKDEKPVFKKKFNSFKNNVIINVLITLLIKQKLNAAVDTFKHNIILTGMN